MLHLRALALPVVILPFACSVTTNKVTSQNDAATMADPDAGGTQDDAGAGAGDMTLSCLQVLQCIAACPNSDTACPDACVAKGTQDAQAKVSDLATCIQASQCQDAACAQSKCETQLSACMDQSSRQAASGGQPVTGPAPTGSIPQELVGTWFTGNTSFSAGSGEEFVLNADGTMTHALRIESTYMCTTSFARSSSGTATATSNTLTVYETDNLVKKQTCNGPVTQETPPARQLDYAYRIGVDQGVTKLYLTPTGGSEQGYAKQ